MGLRGKQRRVVARINYLNELFFVDAIVVIRIHLVKLVKKLPVQIDM